MVRAVGEGPLVDQHGVADHVVQGLRALGEGDHQVADAQQDGAEDGGEVAREPAPETAARAVAADDLDPDRHLARRGLVRSEEHTSELQSLMRISYAVFCLKKNKPKNTKHHTSDRKNYTTTTRTQS